MELKIPGSLVVQFLDQSKADAGWLRGRRKKGREVREKLACEQALRGDLAPKRPVEPARNLEKSVKRKGSPFLLLPVPSPSFPLPLFRRLALVWSRD